MCDLIYIFQPHKYIFSSFPFHLRIISGSILVKFGSSLVEFNLAHAQRPVRGVGSHPTPRTGLCACARLG